MSAGGKGSAPRPYSVDRKTFEDNWDRIFGQSKKNLVDEEIQTLQSFGDKRSLGEQQSSAWLKDEYYDLDIDRDDTIV